MQDDPGQTWPVPGAGFGEGTVEADGFRIRYRHGGRGPALVCLHGAGGLRLSRTHDILAATRRVVALEMPGFGTVDDGAGIHSIEGLAATVNRAVAALGIDRYDLMGTSFGAKVALWSAILAPDPVQSVVLIAPAAIRIERPGGPVAPTPDALYAHPERQPPPEPVAPEVAARRQALVRRLIGPPRDAAFEARLAGLAQPVLALFGTCDRITPADAAHLYKGALPNCHLVMVYDAAHAIDADRPEATAEVVQHFLEQHERFLVTRTSGLIHP